MPPKRTRAPNFTESEKQVFMKFVPAYKDLIENKKTDALTRSQKAEGWNELCILFNSASSIHDRTVDQLKNLWDTLKKDARKAKGGEKKEVFRTGGGTKHNSKEPTKVDDAISAVLGPSGIGLNNPYDGMETLEEGQQYGIVFVTNDTTNPESISNESTVTIQQDNAVPSTSSGESGVDLPVTGVNWGETVPAFLQSKKSHALRIPKDQGSQQVECTESQESANNNIKRKVGSLPAEVYKRRRPTLQGDPITAKELVTAKVQLANLIKSQLVEEEKRKQEEEKRKQEEEKRKQALFEIEKQRS